MATIVFIIVSLCLLLVLDYSIKMRLSKNELKEMFTKEEDLYSTSMDEYYNNVFMDHIA